MKQCVLVLAAIVIALSAAPPPLHAESLGQGEQQTLSATAMFDTLQLARLGRYDEARARQIISRYRNKVLCVGTRTTVANNTPGAVRNCQATVPLDGLSVNGSSRTVRFGAAGKSFKMPTGPSLACADPDGDFEHCNNVCSSVPQTPESGSTGCSLGCLAAYVWDGIWCD
jgi:hypothetical protein